MYRGLVATMVFEDYRPTTHGALPAAIVTGFVRNGVMR